MMSSSVYQINKGINKPIEFKGLKAQYIWYFGGGVIVHLLFFAVLYIIGINSFICIGIVLLTGTLMVLKIYSMSRHYGEHGLIKAIAKRRIPKVIKVKSRQSFFKKR